MDSTFQTFDHLSRKAASCSECFSEGWVKRPFIGIAQPRWVGPKYWESTCRVVVLMLNPGQGKANERARESKRLLQGLRDGVVGIDDIFKFQKEGMKLWGKPKGRFLDYYCGKLGLDLDEIAFANVAWCATEGNNYQGRCWIAVSTNILPGFSKSLSRASCWPAGRKPASTRPTLPASRS